MFKYLNQKRKKGQSTLEYAILIIIIIGALLSIQVYIKRGIQGRLKSSADDIGEQYSPGNQKTNLTKTTTSQTLDTFNSGKTRSQLLVEEKRTVKGTSNILNVQEEFWGKSPAVVVEPEPAPAPVPVP